jgi:hypothetical protein
VAAPSRHGKTHAGQHRRIAMAAMQIGDIHEGKLRRFATG